MKLLKRGKNISAPSVENITPFGIWLFVEDTEYFLSYRDFPMFLDKPVKDIMHITMPHHGHLRWPDIDVDLEMDSIKEPERYPLLDRGIDDNRKRAKVDRLEKNRRSHSGRGI